MATHFTSWIAIGHLAEAETECVSKYLEIAGCIRDIRLALMGDMFGGKFEHGSLMACLNNVRREAEKVNGITEEERVRVILFHVKPDKKCDRIGGI